MWEIIAVLAIVVIGSRLDKILKELRLKNPEYKNDMETKKEQKAATIYNLVHSSVGERVVVTSTELRLVSESPKEAVIKRVEGDWLALEYERKKKKKTLYMKIEDLHEVSLIK